MAAEHLDMLYRQFILFLAGSVIPMIYALGFIGAILSYYLDKLRVTRLCYVPRASKSPTGLLVFAMFVLALVAIFVFPSVAARPPPSISPLPSPLSLPLLPLPLLPAILLSPFDPLMPPIIASV